MIKSEEDIKKLLQEARKSGKSVSVFSGGWNWGYGEKESSDPGSIEIDLTRMNKILGFNPQTGALRIQPGVNQAILEEFLQHNNYDFYVPNTGAGSRGSLLGNALERGFGISPVSDHASGLVSIRGLLADGSVYESALSEVNPKLAESFGWGVGPQLDKLVSQSSWIIVTEATLILQKKFQCTDILVLPFKNQDLSLVIETLRELHLIPYVPIGSVKIFYKNQVSKNLDSKEWYMTMVLYSHPWTRRCTYKFIKHYFRRFKYPLKCLLNRKKITRLILLLRLFPLQRSRELAEQLLDLKEMLNLAEGRVSEIGYKALDPQFNYMTRTVFDMSKLKQKLIWLSPLCELSGARANELLALISEQSDPRFQFNTFTWTVLNGRTLALVMPILFNQEQEEDFWPWYEELHRKLKQKGFIPYRFHVKMMKMLRQELLPKYFRHVDKFEESFDPTRILMRGRYSQ